MGYHSGLNGEYNIPVEVNRHPITFLRGCKENLPKDAIKVETYLKDDTLYFVLPNNYKPVKIAFDNDMDSNIYGGKGNQKLNVDFHSTGYYQDDNCVNINDNSNAYNSNGYTSLFDSLLDLSDQVNAMGCSAEDAGDTLCNLINKLYNR